MLTKRTVHERIGPAAGGEAVGPQAFDPTVTPIALGDISKCRCVRRRVGRIGDGAVLAAQDKDRAFGAVQNAFGAV